MTQEPPRAPPVAPRARMLTLLSLGFSVPMAIVIGAAAGWLADRWLGTAPWLFLVFLGFGIVAGLRNVVRAASAVAGDDPPGKDPGSEDS